MSAPMDKIKLEVERFSKLKPGDFQTTGWKLLVMEENIVRVTFQNIGFTWEIVMERMDGINGPKHEWKWELILHASENTLIEREGGFPGRAFSLCHRNALMEIDKGDLRKEIVDRAGRLANSRAIRWPVELIQK